MTPGEIIRVLEESGALLTGHFLLSSGRHSDTFIQKFRVFEQPKITKSLGDALAKAFEGRFDVVASPAVGALVLGFATALAANTRFVFAERVNDTMGFRRGFHLGANERVLVVEDVLTTGASAREVVFAVQASGAVAVGVAALIDRGDSARPRDLGAPVHALASLEVTSWDPAECPLCQIGAPLDDPGSRRL